MTSVMSCEHDGKNMIDHMPHRQQIESSIHGMFVIANIKLLIW